MDESRRRLIKKAAAGAGVVWATPSITSLVTPASAGTPPPTSSSTSTTTPLCPGTPPCQSSGAWTFFTFASAGDTVGPFAITVAPGDSLQVTDAFCVGDRFEIFVDSQSLGLTSEPCGPQVCQADDTNDPDVAYADGRYSAGCFPVDPGGHSLVIEVNASPFRLGGGAYFRGGNVSGSGPAAPSRGGPNG